MTRFTTTAVLVFGAVYVLLSLGEVTGVSESLRLGAAAWLLVPSLMLALAVWRLESLPGPQAVLLIAATLLVAANTTVWRWLALGPRDGDTPVVLALLPIVEVFLLLPALLAAWLAQSLHLLRQLRDLRTDAGEVARLQTEMAATQSRVAALEAVLEERARRGPETPL